MTGSRWLPFDHLDPVVGVELRAMTYNLDSGGRGIQITLESKHSGRPIQAVRLPEEAAQSLAMRILAEIDGDPNCACRDCPRHPDGPAKLSRGDSRS
jgi:hypothetical protein